MHDQNKAVILARVSGKAQEIEGYSLDSQEKFLRDYTQNIELAVMKVFKLTETASKQQCRKIFQELLVYLVDNHISHLVVEKTDRLTRNLRDGVAIDDWLEADESRRVHAVKESIVLHKNSRSDVKFMWQIHLAVAKKFTDNLREEAMKGWAEKLAQGWLPAVPPPGYVTITQNGKRVHVPDKDTREIVRKLFSLYLQPNQSIATITDEMRLHGLTTRKGRPYAQSHVQKILTNPFYVGVNRFDGKDYPGVQERIIDKRVFKAVQQKIHRGQPSRRMVHNPIFKSLIRCEDCSGVISWEKHKGRYYGCCQRRAQTCKRKKFVREDRVDEVIVSKLESLVSPSQAIADWILDSLRTRYQNDVDVEAQAAAALEQKLNRLKRMDSELYDDKLAGEISKDIYAQKHELFKAEMKLLQDQQVGLGEAQRLRFDHGLSILELAQRAPELYARKTPDEKRRIITELFQSITVKEDSVSVTNTALTRIIANNNLKTGLIAAKEQMADRTIENVSINGGKNYELLAKTMLQPIWQGHVESNHDLRFWRPIY